MNDEILAVLSKLVSVVETLTTDTAELLGSHASSFRGDYVAQVRNRADALREAGHALRTIADKALPKLDS